MPHAPSTAAQQFRCRSHLNVTCVLQIPHLIPGPGDQIGDNSLTIVRSKGSLEPNKRKHYVQRTVKEKDCGKLITKCRFGYKAGGGQTHGFRSPAWRSQLPFMREGVAGSGGSAVR
jgi:hypothetical protein